MILENITRQLLLKCDPEKAHRLAKYFIRLRYATCFSSKQHKMPVNFLGLTFPNSVGLAAGWDSNGDCFDALFRLGFGFVEVGGVTPKAQMGNPKPRIFRIPEKQALINRMGFCNAGVEALVAQLQTRREPGILGVNIAKNKETSLENALTDYEICLKAVYPYVDYITINISSPNTPGLRELQSEQYLKNLLQGIRTARKSMAAKLDRDLPVLVKTTVDLPLNSYERFVQTVLDCEVDGVVISNTTVDHAAVTGCRYADEAGGLSGKPLLARSINMISKIAEISEKKLSIIGCGGIFSGSDALLYQQAGATLFQVFTGFVYRGPKLIAEIMSVLQ